MADEGVNNTERDSAAIANQRGGTAGRMIRAGESPDKVRKYVARQGDEESKIKVDDRAGRDKNNKRLAEDSQREENKYASYRKGGKVRKTGVAKLHKSERVKGKRKKSRGGRR